jgi:PhnB protein
MAQPIPQGSHTVTPHLVVKGAARAIDFYAAAFGAVEHHRMPGPDGLLGHAQLQIGDSLIFLADEFPGSPSPRKLKGSPVTIHLYVEDVDAVFARALRAGAKVKMPLMDMFWGDRYGQVVDPFGHAWSIATHKEDVSPEEMAKRGAKAMAEMAAAAKKPAPRKKTARKAPKKTAKKSRSKK